MSGYRRLFLPVFIIAFFIVGIPTVNSQTPFAIESIQPTTNGGIAITWTTVPGRTDQLMYTDSLGGGWSGLALHAAGSSQMTLCYTDSPPADVTQRFYQIKGQREVVMSLVLDRSGSMNGDGGSQFLPAAVSTFIDYFDDNIDRASLVSFSYAARTDVTMRHSFKEPIKNVVNAMVFDGWTCTERGLTNALAENNSVSLLPGESAVKVIVLFTDGLANTWYWPGFNCGPRNIAPGPSLYDPITGAGAQSGCTIPVTIPSIDGVNNVDTTDTCGDHGLYGEAQLRAESIAYLARATGNCIYVIALGNINGPRECGRPPLNPDFLKNVANTPDSLTYNISQPSGDYVIVSDVTQLGQAFAEIASKIASH